MRFLLFSKNDEWCQLAEDFLKNYFKDFYVFYGDWSTTSPWKLDFKRPYFEAWKGDYIISYLCPWKIPGWILKKAKKGAINFHSAPPEYPGIGSYNFALYNGDKEFGVTAHYMAEKLDSGPIIKVKRFPINVSTPSELKAETMRHLFLLFCDTMKNIIEGDELPTSSEKWAKEPYSRKDYQELTKITLDMSKEEIQRRINSTYFPNALDKPYLDLDGKKYFLSL